jgi:hypothetical protein
MASPLGRALLDFWGGGIRRSFGAKGWHAQLSELTKNPQGYKAMEAAGISVTPKTLFKWLSQDGGRDDFSPNRQNVEKIQRAYDIRRGAWNPDYERHQYRIKGIVKIAGDVRDRGADGTNPLRINGESGDWTRIRDAYAEGELTEEDAEEWFIEDVILEDLGDGTDGWEFPGSSYSVS